MWRLWVLAGHWRWLDMLGVGLAMIDGSYWAEPLTDDRDFPEPADSPGYDG